MAANVATAATIEMGMMDTNGRSSESHPSSLEDGRVVTDEGKAKVVPTTSHSSRATAPTIRNDDRIFGRCLMLCTIFSFFLYFSLALNNSSNGIITPHW